MAFDVVTAKQGKPHVTADQQALMQAGMLGKGRYALDALNNLACTMTDSNTLTVDTGGLMVDGRWVVNEAQTSFAIANGSQAQIRKDLAVLEITVDPSTGVTSLEEKVLQGATAATAAAAADPTYEAGDLYTGLTAVVPIARITLDGLTPTCEALLPSVADLKTISEQTKKLGDSVSPTQLSFTKHVSINGGSVSAVRSGNVVVLAFFCSMSDLPSNGSTVKLFSGLPEALMLTRGFIAAQYANLVADFRIDTSGTVYITNKSDCNDAYWVVGSLTYIAAE